MKFWIVFWLTWHMVLGAQAAQAPELAEDPMLERRLLGISDELRCLVCQNESLAGSRADLALDLRREIRSLIRSGKSDTEILAFMVERYGDFVRYRPPFTPVTWLLWLGPFVLLVGGAGVLVHLARSSPSSTDPPVLDGAQRARVRALLDDTESAP